MTKIKLDVSRPLDEIAQELWAKFLLTNPGPNFLPWDQMSEIEKIVMRTTLVQKMHDKGLV